MSDHDPPGQRTALIPAASKPLKTPASFAITSYQLARFIPRIVSLTAIPELVWLTVTVALAGVPPVIVRVIVATTEASVPEVPVMVIG